jgi:hypothetical protein
MNLRITGLLLITAMMLTGFIARDLFNLNVPYWISSVLGALGIIALGGYAYQRNKFRNFVVLTFGLLLIFIVLIVIQFTTTL